MGETPGVLLRIDGPIAWIELNNPQRRNAMSIEMWDELDEAIETCARAQDIRVLILRGSGEEAFCAGADVSQFETSRANAAQSAAYVRKPLAVQKRIRDFPRPVIAMIHGFCLGRGLDLALQADLRFAATTASLGAPAARLGLGYTVEATTTLVRQVGVPMAKDLLFSGRMVSGEEALSIGLVERAVAPRDLEALARDYAMSLAGNAPLSIAAAKLTANAVSDLLDRELAECEAAVRACMDSADYEEGRRARREKRAPVFTGR